jgi:hypothetical protein
MAQRPGESLPAQFERWGDLKAAYRLLSSDAIDPVAISEPHRRLVRKQLEEHEVVLLVQDDTHLSGRCDRMQHTTLAALPCGELLGMLDQRFFDRIQTPADETRRERMNRWRESCVWQDAVHAIGAAPARCRFIHVADRAADALAVMRSCVQEGVGFVIRAKHDRRIAESHDSLLRAQVAQQPTQGVIDIEIGAQRDAKGRITRRSRKTPLSVRFASVTLQPPWNHPPPHDEEAQPLPVQVILLREETPGEDDPVEWLLLTSEAVHSFADAQRLIGYYQRRWIIEEWHRALKEGCAAESAQLDEPEDHLRLAAILSVIAVRMLQLRDLADPEHPCADDAEALQRWAPPIWIKVVATLGRHTAPTLTPQQFLLTIAKRGGYLARRNDPRPGWKVLWRGWQEVSILVEGAELAESTSPSPTKCG